eukprot:SAG22_NODE_104_length_20159_cov_5.877517_29_plen_65_part_00
MLGVGASTTVLPGVRWGSARRRKGVKNSTDMYRSLCGVLLLRDFVGDLYIYAMDKLRTIYGSYN